MWGWIDTFDGQRGPIERIPSHDSVAIAEAADHINPGSFLKGETAMPAKQTKRTTKAAAKRTTKTIGKPAPAKRTTQSAKRT
ncbi:MAG: hypothetical protein ACM359_22935, partial [Bacillota bacterium]